LSLAEPKILFPQFFSMFSGPGRLSFLDEKTQIPVIKEIVFVDIYNLRCLNTGYRG